MPNRQCSQMTELNADDWRSNDVWCQPARHHVKIRDSDQESSRYSLKPRGNYGELGGTSRKFNQTLDVDVSHGFRRATTGDIAEAVPRSRPALYLLLNELGLS